MAELTALTKAANDVVRVKTRAFPHRGLSIQCRSRKLRVKLTDPDQEILDGRTGNGLSARSRFSGQEQDAGGDTGQ